MPIMPRATFGARLRLIYDHAAEKSVYNRIDTENRLRGMLPTLEEYRAADLRCHCCFDIMPFFQLTMLLVCRHRTVTRCRLPLFCSAAFIYAMLDAADGHDIIELRAARRVMITAMRSACCMLRVHASVQRMFICASERGALMPTRRVTQCRAFERVYDDDDESARLLLLYY